MATTLYDVVGATFDPMDFTPSTGSLQTCVDEPADTPNTADYGEFTGVATQNAGIDLDIEPPTFAATDTLIVRVNCETVENAIPPYAQIFEAYLIDDDATIVGSLTGGNQDVPTSPTMLELTIAPGGPSSSYNFASARVAFTCSVLINCTIRVYAVDFAVDDGAPDGPPYVGPAGQQAMNASHHGVC